jgi:hypothetical protein
MGNELALNADGFSVPERVGNNFIIGGMIKYHDHVYTLSKTEPVPLGTVLVALNIVTAWVKWWDHAPVEHRVTQPGQLHPNREDLGDLDSKNWQLGLDDRPADCWKDSRYLHLIDPQSGRDFTFVGDTTGTRIAIGELKSAIRNVRMVRPGAVAVVKLQTGTFKSKRFGLVPRPVFEIVEYRGGSEAAPTQIADQSKQQTGEIKAPPLAEAEAPPWNDPIPDLGRETEDPAPIKTKKKK